MFALLITLLAPPPAASLADYRSDIERCLGKVALSDTIEDAGKNAFVWHLTKPLGTAKKVVVLKTRSKGCEGVFTVGRADLRVIAPFDRKNGGMKAFVVQNQPDNECKGGDEGGCERVLILRDKTRRYLSVLPIGQCEWALSLTAVNVLPGQPSIMVECGFSGGGDMWGHSHQLVHVINGELTSVISAGTGYSSDETVEKPGCRVGPNGYVKVKKTGKAAEVEVYEPDAERVQTLRWDGKAFKQIAVMKRAEDTLGSGPMRCDLPRH